MKRIRWINKILAVLFVPGNTSASIKSQASISITIRWNWNAKSPWTMGSWKEWRGRREAVKSTSKNYTGSLSTTFRINPKATTLKRVTAASKGFTVKWTKQTKQTTGYQIQYATNSKFTSGAKTVTVTKNKTTSKKIINLKAKKKYYVRIRTYKTVSGKKYYSNWSKAKTVTTKK